MTVLNRIGEAILEHSERTKESLTAPLEFSELLLITDDAGDFAVSFNTLGQDFLLNSQGIFTFNEIGESFSLEPNFEASVTRFLEWRFATLKEFGI